MRRLLWIVPLALVFVFVGIGLFRVRPGVELGGPAPAFSLPSLSDPQREIGLADLEGRPAVLNFWASWCEPCRDEAPELARVGAKHADSVAFLGVNILDGREEALAYVEEFGIPYPSVRDSTGRVARRYMVTGAPETAFLDARGNLIGIYIGAFEPGQLETIVRDLLRLGPGEVLEITGRGETRPVP